MLSLEAANELICKKFQQFPVEPTGSMKLVPIRLLWWNRPLRRLPNSRGLEVEIYS